MKRKISDKERLDWLEKNEAHLVTDRERLNKVEYCIWWRVVNRNKSLSGHPLGSPREAIDAAIKSEEGRA